MDRESAEVRVREMEDQLAELQDELRRENGSKTVFQKHAHTDAQRKIISSKNRQHSIQTKLLLKTLDHKAFH